MHGYLSADVICSEKRTVFRERSSRKTVSFEEQITSADKYPCTFSRQMEAIVYIWLESHCYPSSFVFRQLSILLFFEFKFSCLSI